jgi:23S rRNA (pseudouridine1915-N3)-methyltransferase
MHVRLIAVGKLREPYIAAAAADFRKRLQPYHRLEEIEIRAADGAQPERAMASEGEAILRVIAPADVVWLLEREGTEFSSIDLAERIERAAVDGVSSLSFVIAGTFGASAAVHARANVRWSLSRLTFLHEWARVLVLEQLYRAAKITRGEPYHH